MLFVCSSTRAFEDSIHSPAPPSKRLRTLRVPTFESSKQRKVSKAMIGTPTGFVHFQHMKSGSTLNDTDLKAISTVEWRTLVSRKLSDASHLSVECDARKLEPDPNMDVPAQSPSTPPPLSPSVTPLPSPTNAHRRSTLVMRKPVPAFIDESIVSISPGAPTATKPGEDIPT